MKKILSIILSLLMISSTFTGLGITVNASEISSSTVSSSEADFEYEINEFGEAVITYYNGKDSEIIIPDSIDGYKVTGIASRTFKGNLYIECVEIPYTIDEIGEGAFEYCENLYSVRINDESHLRIIEPRTFENCKQLSEVVLPESLESIREMAFDECYSLEYIVIPQQVSEIADDAFSYMFYDFAIHGYVGTYAQDYAIEKGIRFVPLGGSDFEYVISGLDEVTILSYCGTDSYVEIPKYIDGYLVTEIGSGAFENNHNIVSVSIPESVYEIGEYAFENCKNLKEVYINNHSRLHSIEYRTFANCVSLEEVILPEQLLFIEGMVFDGCDSLEYIVIPEKVDYIADDALGSRRYYVEIHGYAGTYAQKYALDNYFVFVAIGSREYTYDIVPNGIVITKYTGFDKRVEIPSNIDGYDVVGIGDFAFQYNGDITDVSIPDTVTSIGVCAFESCYNLEVVFTGNANIEIISERAFYGCSKLEYIPTYSLRNLRIIGDYAFVYCTSLKELVAFEAMETIGDGAFAFCENMKFLYIFGAPVFGENVFWGVSDRFCIKAEFDSQGYYYAKENNINVIGLYDEVDFETGFAYNIDYSSDRKATITGYIGDDTDITIPETIFNYYNGYYYDVVAIGEMAFIENDALTSVVIPDTVTEIGEFAFASCYNLTEVKLPSGLTKIREYTFMGCFSLNEIVIPNSVIEIGIGAFLNCDKLTSVKLPEGLKTIEDATFGYCENLTEIIIPDSVIEIGNEAFAYCRNLTSVTLPENLKTIKDYAFSHCENLTGIIIPKDTTVGYDSFDDINEAFVIYGYNNSSAQTYALENHIIFVCLDSIIDENTGLRYVMNENNEVIIIGYEGVDADIVIPEMIEGCRVVAIGNNAFENCLIIKTMAIPDSVSEIGQFAFYGCESLVSVTIPDTITEISESVFRGCKSMSSVVIPDSVEKIGTYAFSNCKSLSSIVIPDSVEKIGRAAFSNCESLLSVTLPYLIKEIDYATFSNCKSLSSIVIPDSVEEIGIYAFSNCESLLSVTLPDSVTKIGAYAFRGCKSLSSIVIPDSVKTIDLLAFSGCTSLNEITIPKDVTIVENAFDGVNPDLVIYGYTDSPAQDFAENNGYIFVSLDAVKGDMSGDGVVDINDVTDIQKLIIGEEELTAQQLYVSDVDGDGIVCVRDATYIQKYLAGVIETL